RRNPPPRHAPRHRDHRVRSALRPPTRARQPVRGGPVSSIRTGPLRRGPPDSGGGARTGPPPARDAERSAVRPIFGPRALLGTPSQAGKRGPDGRDLRIRRVGPEIPARQRAEAASNEYARNA